MQSPGETTIYHVYKCNFDWINEERKYLRSFATKDAAEDWINELRVAQDDWLGYQIIEEIVEVVDKS